MTPNSEPAHSRSAQNYTAWFTDYPSTHVKAGETVEVVTREQYDLLRVQLEWAREREAKWLQAFNSLEKPVTRHIEQCMDAEDLDRAHGVVMRRFGPNG